MKTFGYYLSYTAPLLIALAAFFTNPTIADFDRYMEKEVGMLSIRAFERKNCWVFSLYSSDSYSVSRGHDRRVIVGAFGQFAELSQSSSW